MTYIAEKFGITINGIVTSYKAQTLQERVSAAAFGTLTLSDDDFPEDLRPKCQKFRQDVTRVSDEKKGSFQASAEAMKDADAHRVIKEFYELYHDVMEAYHEQVLKYRKIAG